MRKCILLSIVVALVVARQPSRVAATATDDLREKLSDLAKQILAAVHNQPVCVGQFVPVGLGPSNNAAAGIELALARELEQSATGSVDPDAKFVITGKYKRVHGTAGVGIDEIWITASIDEKNSGNDSIELKPVIVDSNSAIAGLLQITGSVTPPNAKTHARGQDVRVLRNQELIQKSERPSVYIHGSNRTLISSEQGSPYAVEILAKPLKNHQTTPAISRPARDEHGQAFVRINIDELYQVKVYNDSDRETAVALSVDGLDMFHFSKDRTEDGRPRYSHWIVNPKSSSTIVGWHNTASENVEWNYFSFLVTGYGSGAISNEKILNRGRVGVIHVEFSDCRPIPEGITIRGVETGLGPPITLKQKEQRYAIDPPREFVSVRYARPDEVNR